MKIKSLKKFVAVCLAVIVAVNSVPIGFAQAEMITTEQVLQNTDASRDRARIETFLSRDDVRQQLVLLGVNPQEASSRAGSLTNDEVQQIAGRLDELPAGEGGVGAVVGAIVLIFLVLLITDLLGLTDVFPFVKNTAN
jgi:hypothetical protein